MPGEGWQLAQHPQVDPRWNGLRPGLRFVQLIRRLRFPQKIECSPKVLPWVTRVTARQSLPARLIRRTRWLSKLARRRGCGGVGPYTARAVHSLGQWDRGQGFESGSPANNCSATFLLRALSRHCPIECCMKSAPRSGAARVVRALCGSDVRCAILRTSSSGSPMLAGDIGRVLVKSQTMIPNTAERWSTPYVF
jgi:hypothetical protein